MCVSSIDLDEMRWIYVTVPGRGGRRQSRAVVDETFSGDPPLCGRPRLQDLLVRLEVLEANGS